MRSFNFSFFADGEKEHQEMVGSVPDDTQISVRTPTDFGKVVCPNSSVCNQIITKTLLLQGGHLSLTLVSEEATTSSAHVPANFDLVPGVYEGGLKIWECSIDLSEYLLEMEHVDNGCRNMKNAKILELGCGHGIPGLVALALDCDHVCFADFNQSVIQEITWKNVLLNFAEQSGRVTCVYGDWNRSIRPGAEYDVILTAETIYNVENCEQILQLISKVLSSSGVAIIATKRYYFGIGGGTAQVEASVRSKFPHLKQAVVRSFQDGKSNIRDIITIHRTE